MLNICYVYVKYKFYILQVWPFLNDEKYDRLMAIMQNTNKWIEWIH